MAAADKVFALHQGQLRPIELKPRPVDVVKQATVKSNVDIENKDLSATAICEATPAQNGIIQLEGVSALLESAKSRFFKLFHR